MTITDNVVTHIDMPGVTLFRINNLKLSQAPLPWKMYSYRLDQVNKAKSKCNYGVINQFSISFRRKFGKHLKNKDENSSSFMEETSRSLAYRLSNIFGAPDDLHIPGLDDDPNTLP